MIDALLVVILGLPMTLIVSAVAFAIGLVGGIPIMLGLRSRILLLRLTTRLAVDIIRGVPPIVWLFLLYFGISIGAIQFGSLSAATVGLGIIASAYMAEIYRGAFQVLPKGQSEAAEALGLNSRTTFWRVLSPQALRTALPSMASYLLSLVKDSSLASTIGVADIVFAANIFARQNPEIPGIVPFVMAAIVYLAVSVPLAIMTRRLDSRLSREAT